MVGRGDKKQSVVTRPTALKILLFFKMIDTSRYRLDNFVRLAASDNRPPTSVVYLFVMANVGIAGGYKRPVLIDLRKLGYVMLQRKMK